MSPTIFQEIFNHPISEFKKHLEQDANDRILFSGKYGIGKTMFLNYVFNEQGGTLSSKYEVYTLSPVNYTVASNEDIIRYIKYDILVEFLRKGKEFNESNLSVLDTLPSYVLRNPDKVAASIVYMVPKIGKDIVEVFKKIEELRNKFKEYHGKLNESDSDKLADYLSEIENSEGSIYDNDIVTRIISSVINDNTDQRKILIVEDLDRLDPEHVFRILNVFAAHFAYSVQQEAKNKFNFDKIILVCDFENIRNIFHNKYGQGVDFVGYIDKFYSSEIYFFDNKPAIISVIQNVFKSIVLGKLDGGVQAYYYNLYFGNGFIMDMVVCFLERGYLNLRNIMKIYGRLIEHHFLDIKLPPRGYPVKAYQCALIVQIKVINDIVGDYTTFYNLTERLMTSKQDFPSYDNIFKQCIFILSFREHAFHKTQPFLYKFVSTELFVSPEYDHDSRLRNLGLHYGTLGDLKPVRGALFEPTIEDFWLAFRMSIDVLHSLGFLR